MAQISNVNENRDKKISVMVTPAMREHLDNLARSRKGTASVSSAVYDILVYFFANCGTDVFHNGSDTLQDAQQ